MNPTWESEGVQLFLGDCLEVLPTLGSADAVVTDPPYGLEYDPQRYNRSTGTDSIFTAIEGDDAEFDPRPWLNFPTCLLWGANNYTQHLPRAGWLCWDKRCTPKADKIFGSPFELAWFRAPKRERVFKIARIQHGGVINADGTNVKRVHPTQKPIALMLWCLEVAKYPRTVFDPFMGSGTTGVACVKTGRKFIGIEIHEPYFEIAVKRISEAQMQLRLEGM